MFSQISVAATVTIDFEELVVGDGPVSMSDWMQVGNFELSGGVLYPSGDPAEIYEGQNGTQVFGANYVTPVVGNDAILTLTIRRTDGGVFGVHDFDAAISSNGTAFGSGVEFLGFPSGLDGPYRDLRYSPLGTGDWLNLTAFQIEVYSDGAVAGGLVNLEIDNIVVSTVPIPAAVWLFGSALAGLGFMRRRPTA